MVKVDYDPILGCVGWEFKSPPIDLRKDIYLLSNKLNQLQKRPKNVSNINYIKK